MSKSPWDFLEPWRRSFPRGSASFSFVSTDGVSRSVAAADTADDAGTGSDVTHVDDVLPVEAFGQTVADEVVAHGAGTAMCFYPLTDLLEYVDVETAFDFLHVVLARATHRRPRRLPHRRRRPRPGDGRQVVDAVRPRRPVRPEPATWWHLGLPQGSDVTAHASASGIGRTAD